MYLLAPPVVHVGNLRPLVGLADLGLRIGIPVTTGVAGFALAAASNCKGEFCALAGAAVGVLAGVAGAIVVDAAALAREQVPLQRKPGAATIVPLVGPRASGGLDLGVSGTF